MLAQGDFDMQTPLFDFYRRTLAIAEQRARRRGTAPAAVTGPR
jgi:hypothetical protein